MNSAVDNNLVVTLPPGNQSFTYYVNHVCDVCGLMVDFDSTYYSRVSTDTHVPLYGEYGYTVSCNVYICSDRCLELFILREGHD